MKVNAFQHDEHALGRDKLASHGFSEGDGCFVLGFPMGLVGEFRSTVIVRSGTIATFRDMLDRRSDMYYIDSQVFPGNSGGPVVSRPELTAIGGTNARPRAQLIGIVKG